MNATAADVDELDRILDAIDRGQWPVDDDIHAWEMLRNWCFQEECRLADEIEAESWDAAMRALQHRFLPHSQFVSERGDLLRARVRSRKLLQSRLRWRYGYKAGRRPGLIRRDVQQFHAAWTAG